MKEIVVTLPLSEEQRGELSKLAPGYSFTFTSYSAVERHSLKGASLILGNFPLECLKEAPLLEWVQLYSVGAETYNRHLSPDVVITNAGEAYTAMVSEHALALLFSLMKNLPIYFEQQSRGVWQKHPPIKIIAASTVLVVGSGSLGRTIARHIKGMGARVIGVRHSSSEPLSEFDELYTIEKLDTLLPASDVVILTLPETKESYHLFDAKRLSLMAKDSYLINVGRGSAIDTKALQTALEEGHLGGAALDVFETEPIPQGDPLFKTPNLIITPHVAGNPREGRVAQALYAITKANLILYLKGEALLHRIDRSKGY